MKIVSRKEFLKLPSGTLWSYYEPCCFRELNIKTSSPEDGWANDFVLAELIGEFDSFDSEEFTEKCHRMENGESFPAVYDNTTREGLFEDEQLFAIYDKQDVENLIKTLQGTLIN